LTIRAGAERLQKVTSLAFCVLWAGGLLAADGAWVCGIGRFWGATSIFGWMQRQPGLSLAPHQQVETGDQVLELLV
jgi:TM2 domain-containing membrane protein YozV